MPEPRIRDCRDADLEPVRDLHRLAFGSDAEATLVARLHELGAALVSLVAESDDGLSGHILFSPVTLQPDAALVVAGLAPMAVRPARQREGIGSALAVAGLARCRELGVDAVVVLGHAGYYPRFGFRRAGDFGLRCVYDVPADVFMALELRPGCLGAVAAVAHYHPAFEQL